MDVYLLVVLHVAETDKGDDEEPHKPGNALGKVRVHQLDIPSYLNNVLEGMQLKTQRAQ